MTDKTFLGEFEQMVLLAILQLGDGAYAVPIRREIENSADRKVARGALYTALERLETKGCVESLMGDPTAERGGRSRRYYTVTGSGVTALQNSRYAMLRLWRGLDSLLDKRS
jgi:DNA-binding PadR family transcriptional regulator